MALQLRRRIKDLTRFEHIVAVLFEEGFGTYLAKTKLRKIVPVKKRLTAEIKKKERVKPEGLNNRRFQKDL